jgi:aldose 1-epimerase
MPTWTQIFFSVIAIAVGKWLIKGGTPFAGWTAMFPTNSEGKYIIEAEGIRLAFTNRNGGAPTNLWINDTNENEIDIILGLDKVEDYDDYTGILGGAIGEFLRMAYVRRV